MQALNNSLPEMVSGQSANSPQVILGRMEAPWLSAIDLKNYLSALYWFSDAFLTNFLLSLVKAHSILPLKEKVGENSSKNLAM